MRLRIFLTCWLVYAAHFATNTVREIYPALALGDHLSFDVREYLGLHPDLFEIAGRGAFINNNPGASIVGAVPYALARPLIDRAAAAVQRQRQALGASDAPRYDSPWPLARAFHQKARARGLDVKFGLAAWVMQAFAMAPLSALAAVVMFSLLRERAVPERAAVLLTLLYAFATPVFFRTAHLNQNMLVGHCGFLAFALLQRPAPGGWQWLAAGLLCGWAVVCDYSGAITLLVVGGYALGVARGSPERSRAALARFAAGVAAAIAVLLAYQWSSFGSPFLPAQRYMPPARYSHLGYHGMDWPGLALLWENTFGLRFGLFASAPILLLCLYPPAWWSDRVRIVGRREAWCIGAYALLLLLFSSANQYGRLQVNTGVRYMVPVAPFLFLIAAGVLLRMRAGAAVVLGGLCGYWSWCLVMYREVELGRGVVDAVIAITGGGVQFPWLTTVERMGYVRPGLLAWPVLAAMVAGVWLIWRRGGGHGSTAGRRPTRGRGGLEATGEPPTAGPGPTGT